MKRKFYALLLAGAMMLSLAACGTNAASPSDNGANNSTDASQPPETTPAADPSQIGTTTVAGSQMIRLTLEGDEGTQEITATLMDTPAATEFAGHMAETSAAALKEALGSLESYAPETAASVREKEDRTDHYEDILGTYLVNLSTHPISEVDSREAAKLLKIIGDFERVADHAVNLLESAEELRDKGLSLTASASGELAVLSAAVTEILDLSLAAFLRDDLDAAAKVEPLGQVIDRLKEELRTRHILRLQKGECTTGAGYAWLDLLTNLERTADHCSNIAGRVIDVAHDNLNLHQSLRELRNDSEDFRERFKEYQHKYTLNRDCLHSSL